MISNKTQQDFLKQFGSKLEEIKKTKGLTYRKIAENCDLDHSYLSKIARGEANITLETVLELCKGLNIQPAELFTYIINLDNL